ncbi:MAG: GNAT family N-acetyltransferase [Candidatus Poseidoniaceae archaeon]
MPVKGPNWTPDSKYYDCRYVVLREPLGFPRGAEILADDDQAVHAWVEDAGKVVAVGRAHLIPNESDGSQADHAGPGAAHCPAFGPLVSGGPRPAIQIRQMGTLDSHRRKGYAAEVLSQLEKSSVELLGASAGFLQAREVAIPFYSSQGWEIIDEPYEILGIGPHRSMMKHFR